MDIFTGVKSRSTVTGVYSRGVCGGPVVLDTPTKSANDNKEYRVIRLKNGLTALLVSDSNNVRNDASSSESSSDEGSYDEGSSAEEDEQMVETDDDADGCEQHDVDSKAASSNRKMKLFKGAGILKDAISFIESLTLDAAAALCVGVGSFSDPDDIPGFSHFLEHMVFMGSKKYPAENAFDAFIKRYGGFDNASTDCETTTFQFEIHRRHFQKALDLFAQFFIAPLMVVSSMDREIESVASEFELSLPSDESRRQQLFGGFAVEGHPMRKFMWGNADTLKVLPTKLNINVHQRLADFWKEQYSAHLMTLAVQSQETLDTLEKWVTEIFSEVPCNGMPRPIFNAPSNPFDTAAFHKIYKVVPVKCCHRVYISWSLHSLLSHYRTKPLHYIWFLLGHEGKGSLLSYLKKRVWALDLWVENAESGFEHNSAYALFCVGIELTDSGLECLFEVVTAVLEYVEMLRSVGPQRRIYEEMKTVADMEFQFQEEIDAVDYVEAISSQMQLYSPKDYLTGDQLMFEFDEQEIVRCLDLLVPDRVNLIVASPKFEKDGDAVCVEPYYGTIYAQSDIKPVWRQAWKDLHPKDEFHIPDVNEYIATDFSIVEPDWKLGEYPVKIIDDGLRRVWYKKDLKFNVPKAYVYFKLVSPFMNHSSALKSVLSDLFVSALAQNMKEDVYASSVALLSYCISSDQDVSGGGLFISVNGFHHKLHALFETIIEYIATFDVTDDLFEALKKELADSYYNAFIKPGKLNWEVRLSVLLQIHWTPVDKIAVIKQLTINDLLTFVSEFKRHLFAEGLIQGNIDAKNAVQFADTVTSKLNFSPVPENELPEPRVLQIPRGEMYCRLHNLNVADGNSVVTSYFQYGPTDIHNMCLMDILVDIMEEPCFDTLRTQEQLGYDVSCARLSSYGILGLRVTVHTQADKYSCCEVDHRIGCFLNQFEEKLNTMPQKDFEIQVSSLIKLKLCVDLHLKEEVDRNWSEIVPGSYVFDRISKEVKHLGAITLPELKNWYELLRNSNLRKLGVQVAGRRKKSCDNATMLGNDDENRGDGLTSPELKTTNCRDQELRELSLKFVQPSVGDTSENVDKYIKDINAFKLTLTVLPITAETGRI